MTVYYSVLALDELADLSKEERHKYLGIIVDGKILQPASCYECGAEIVILEEDTTKTQCIGCSILNDVHFYTDYSPFRAKEINGGFDGVNFYKEKVGGE